MRAMDKEIEAMLVDKYSIFDRARYPDTSFYFLGFECASGWLKLLIEFATKVEAMDLKTIEIFQVKEKYWHLLIYAEVTGKDSETFDNLVDEIEGKSTSICEACGEPKEHHTQCHKRHLNPKAMREWASTLLRSAEIQ
jgi:hypothetical protein